MNNENLSREEAAERSALISVDTYDVHVDLTNAKDPEFESYPTVTTVRFSCNTPAADLVALAKDMTPGDSAADLRR